MIAPNQLFGPTFETHYQTLSGWTSRVLYWTKLNKDLVLCTTLLSCRMFTWLVKFKVWLMSSTNIAGANLKHDVWTLIGSQAQLEFKYFKLTQLQTVNYHAIRAHTPNTISLEGNCCPIMDIYEPPLRNGLEWLHNNQKISAVSKDPQGEASKNLESATTNSKYILRCKI